MRSRRTGAHRLRARPRRHRVEQRPGALLVRDGGARLFLRGRPRRGGAGEGARGPRDDGRARAPSPRAGHLREVQLRALRPPPHRPGALAGRHRPAAARPMDPRGVRRASPPRGVRRAGRVPPGLHGRLVRGRPRQLLAGRAPLPEAQVGVPLRAAAAARTVRSAPSVGPSAPGRDGRSLGRGLTVGAPSRARRCPRRSRETAGAASRRGCRGACPRRAGRSIARWRG